MKLPITDQFLYDFLEGTGETMHFIFKRRRTFGDLLPGPKNPVFEKYRKMKNKRRYSQFICYLKRNNLIRVKNLQGTETILLTKKGIDKAVRASFKIKNNKPKKRKDGKWIMVIFDIPQNRRRDRTLLRSVLINLGYKMFQQSVWVSPYDISEKTEELLQFYSLDRYIRIFLINEL